jgi:hypothetical protein
MENFHSRLDEMRGLPPSMIREARAFVREEVTEVMKTANHFFHFDQVVQHAFLGQLRVLVPDRFIDALVFFQKPFQSGLLRILPRGDGFPAWFSASFPIGIHHIDQQAIFRPLGDGQMKMDVCLFPRIFGVPRCSSISAKAISMAAKSPGHADRHRCLPSRPPALSGFPAAAGLGNRWESGYRKPIKGSSR